MRDLLILLTPITSNKKRNGRVLIFHDIEDKTTFKNRMEWLKSIYSIVSLDVLLQNSPSENEIAISFDDGYHSWYDNVFPVLKELEAPATFFVNFGLLGLKGEKMNNFFSKNCHRSENDLKAISKEELFEISQNPLFTIGGHTKDHVDLGKKMTDAEIDLQVKQDKLSIEKLIRKKIHYFAYPFGQLQNAPLKVQKIVEEAGYLAAFTIIPGFTDTSENLFFINRDSLEFHQSVRVWSKWLKGAYDQWVALKLNFYQFFGIRFR